MPTKAAINEGVLMPTEEKSTDSKADCKLQSIHRVEIMRFFILIEPGTNLFFPKGKKLDSTHFLPSARRNFLLLHYLSYLGFQECDCLHVFHRNHFWRQMYM